MSNTNALIKANLIDTRNDKPKCSVDFISQEEIKKVLNCNNKLN
ncbi:MAG: hypothetical protein ACOX4J_02490 [Anaerovoracaceae bacterium]|jgi:hypothetical protein